MIIGVFMVYITENQLDKRKENNTERSLFMELEVMSSESDRWNIFQGLKKDSLKNDIEKIQDFMFSFQIRDKGDIEKFLIQANETSLALFKQNKDFITDYIETEELTYGDKVKDLDIMIETFVEEERYEDCAILVKIKKKMKKYYLKST
jgi:valyl-tRNA synthetase